MNLATHDNRSFWDHMEEFRWRLVWMLAAWVIAAVFSFFFSIELIHYAGRLVDELIFLSPTEAFGVRFHVSLFLGAVLAFPFWVYEIFMFVWPGLDRKERCGVLTVCASVIVLSTIGVVFADRVLIPISIRFLLDFGGTTLEPMLSAQNYLSFYCGILLFCCLLFNLPFVIMILAACRVVDASWLMNYRRHVCVACFLLSAIVTPPDIITQIILALPLYLLYELSILGVGIFIKNRPKTKDQ